MSPRLFSVFFGLNKYNFIFLFFRSLITSNIAASLELEEPNFISREYIPILLGFAIDKNSVIVSFLVLLDSSMDEIIGELISKAFSCAESCLVSLGKQYPPYPNEGLL